MKKILLSTIIILISIFNTNAQCTGDVLIPNTAFKTYLLAHGSINTDGNAQISCAEAEAFTGLINVSSLGINNLTGIEAFVNITTLYCFSNALTSLDVSANNALTTLWCFSNALTSLDVSTNIALTELQCSANALTSLDVSANTILTTLWCHTNALTSLDISANTALVDLSCELNNLTSLDVSTNTALVDLSCAHNNLTSLDISTNTALVDLDCGFNNLVGLKLTNGNSLLLDSSLSNFANNANLTCIEVDDVAYADANWGALKDATASYSENCDIGCIVNIPDTNFKNALLNNHTIDLNNDGDISCQEATFYTGEIFVYNEGITDLTGIEAFLSLTGLLCHNNDLTSLDVSANAALTELNCGSNDLTSLDVSANTALTNLSCYSNDLTGLDVSENTALAVLTCYSNDLTGLDVSENTALTVLTCSSNLLTSLDISKNTALVNLSCGYNTLTSLDISANTALTTLYCHSNALTSLDASANTALTFLWCFSNDLTSLDVSTNTVLETLWCYSNALTSLDVSANTVLTTLLCHSNALTSLDVSANTVLEKIDCYSNALTSLDVSANTALEELRCENNALTSLDVSANTALKELRCENNALTSLKLTNGNNLLLDSSSSNFKNNTNLACIEVNDIAYANANSGALKDATASYSEDCTEQSFVLTTTATNGAITANIQPTNGTYVSGTVVELTATPDTGYEFTGWSGDASGTTNPLSITINEDVDITAEFSAIQYTLNTTAINGSITRNIPPTNGTYDFGTVVELTATPDTGYEFTSWSGDASGITNPLSITINEDVDITAEFSAIQYTLNTTAINGSITRNIQPTNGTYDFGTVVELTATPDTGYQFTGWSGDASGTTNPLSFTINEDINITAEFSAIQYTLNTTAINGSITRNIPPTNGTYDFGTVVELTATPDTGYEFIGWSGDASGTTNPLSNTINEDINITANFSAIQQDRYTLTVTAINGSISADVLPTNGTYADGTEIELTATPDTGYQFTGWSGDASGTTNPLSFTINEDVDITANFSAIQQDRYTLTVTAINGSISADVLPTNGTYADGTEIELTATPDTGYEFIGWSNGNNTATDNPLSITINEDVDITAEFSAIQYTLNTTAINGSITRNIPPTNGTYDFGTVVELTATPDTGYQFTGWSGDASGTTNPLSFTINEDINITAEFSAIQQDRYTLTVTAINGSISADVLPTNGTYADGTEIELTATPDTGYEFIGWSNGNNTATDNPLSITINEDVDITAEFSAIQYTLNTTAINGSITRNIPPTNGTYDFGTVVELTATPDTGYEFTSWSGDASGITNPLSITINEDVDITAEFSAIQYTLNTTAINGSITRNIQPTNGTYDFGTVVELTATPDTGYQFTGWSGDASGTTNPLTVIMDATKNVIVTFSTTLSVNEVFTKTVSVYPNPTTGNLTISMAEALQKVDIYTLLGKKVYTSTSSIINISHLATGIYVAQITTLSDKVAVRKIIKQ